jgi:5-methylcytosine-specific restriction endonuclease McrA
MGVANGRTKATLTRWGTRCYYCGHELIKFHRSKSREWHRAKAELEGLRLPTTDHVIPRSTGGPNGAWWNHRPACEPCNQRKADQPLWLWDRPAWDRFMKESGQEVRAYIRRHREVGSRWFPTDTEWWEWEW